jgi:hypothetical protein
MFEDTTLEQYSVLEELSSVTPIWRPFTHHHGDDAHEESLVNEEAAKQG